MEVRERCGDNPGCPGGLTGWLVGWSAICASLCIFVRVFGGDSGAWGWGSGQLGNGLFEVEQVPLFLFVGVAVGLVWSSANWVSAGLLAGDAELLFEMYHDDGCVPGSAGGEAVRGNDFGASNNLGKSVTGIWLGRRHVPWRHIWGGKWTGAGPVFAGVRFPFRNLPYVEHHTIVSPKNGTAMWRQERYQLAPAVTKNAPDRDLRTSFQFIPTRMRPAQRGT